MSQDDDAPTPDVVDFDALHAALGDLPPPPTSSSPSVGESQGRSSATYSSARPHTIPPTRAPQADEINAPPVIVQTDDTVPSGPPQKMTVPMGAAPPFGGPGSSGAHPAARPASALARPPTPMAPMTPLTPSRPFTPQPFQATAAPQSTPGPDVVRTVPMPAPRRPRTPTIVVRSRGPTKQQKLLVFMAMLLVFVGGGIAFLVYGKQLGIDIGLNPPPVRPTVMPNAPLPSSTMTATGMPSATTDMPSASTLAPSATATATVSATPSSLPSAPPTASVKKAPRRPPATTAQPPQLTP